MKNRCQHRGKWRMCKIRFNSFRLLFLSQFWTCEEFQWVVRLFLMQIRPFSANWPISDISQVVEICASLWAIVWKDKRDTVELGWDLVRRTSKALCDFEAYSFSQVPVTELLLQFQHINVPINKNGGNAITLGVGIYFYDLIVFLFCVWQFIKWEKVCDLVGIAVSLACMCLTT